MSSPSTLSQPAETPSRSRVGMDRKALFRQLAESSIAKAPNANSIDKNAILLAIKRPKTPKTNNSEDSSLSSSEKRQESSKSSSFSSQRLGRSAIGSGTPVFSSNLMKNAYPKGAATPSSSADESRRIIRKLQEQLETRTQEVDKLEEELDTSRRENAELQREHLKNVQSLKQHYPKLEEEHADIYQRLQAQLKDSIVMRDANRTLKETCDTYLTGQKETSKLSVEVDKLTRENKMLTQTIENEREKGKLALPVVDEDATHSPWNSAEIQEKTEAMDHAFGALSSFHEMYLSDVAVEHGDTSPEEIQQHSLELQRQCIEVAASQLGLFDPRKVEAMKQQNEVLKAELDSAQKEIVDRELQIKVLESKHGDVVTIDRVELATLKTNEAALQTELAAQRISAAANLAKAQFEHNEMRVTRDLNRDSRQALEEKVKSLQAELIKMRALSARMEDGLNAATGQEESSAESERNAQLLSELNEMKEKLTEAERTAKFALKRSSRSGTQRRDSIGGLTDMELERQNMALKAELSTLRASLGLPTVYSTASPRKRSSSSAGAGADGESEEIKDGPDDEGDDILVKDQRLQLLQLRISGFLKKHNENSLLSVLQETLSQLRFKIHLKGKVAEQCFVVVSSLVEEIRKKPDFSARAIGAKDLFEEADDIVKIDSIGSEVQNIDEGSVLKAMDSMMLGLEDYFIDYGFFIGWQNGENVGNGIVYPHLAFREGSGSSTPLVSST